MTGDDIRRARRRRGWTQETLARRLGITQGHISSIELGRREINKTLEILLKKLFRELRDDELL